MGENTRSPNSEQRRGRYTARRKTKIKDIPIKKKQKKNGIYPGVCMTNKRGSYRKNKKIGTIGKLTQIYGCIMKYRNTRK